MFWKKKEPETDTIVVESSDQRQSYRYVLKQGQRFQIEFKGETVWVTNISAGGLGFENKGFCLFDSDRIRFTLDIPDFKGDATIEACLRILKIDAGRTCHCIFDQCTSEHQELLHKYVLEMQKNDLAH